MEALKNEIELDLLTCAPFWLLIVADNDYISLPKPT